MSASKTFVETPANRSKRTQTRPRSFAPPLPQEKGAWVIFYAPLALGFGVAGTFAPLRWFLFTLLVTGLFLARETAGRLLRKKGKEGAALWLGVYSFMALAGGAPLCYLVSPLPLLAVGSVGAALFILHSLLLVTPARKRLDRTLWGEILGVTALCLTAPAAYSVAKGSLDSTAWTLWLGSSLYFAGGIFYVKMWLEAAKHKNDWSEAVRKRIARGNQAYHLLLFAIAAALSAVFSGGFALCLLVSVAPALYRAFVGAAHLSSQLPPLKRVGLLESMRAVWFALWFALAIRAL